MSPAEAARELARRDGVIRKLHELHGPPRLGRPTPAATRFAALARAIVYQQLNGRAAETIHGRVLACLGGEVTPQGILATAEDDLRACGLSSAKTAAVVDLARKVASGDVSLERIGRLSDDDVVRHLVQVKGIGVWTAEMFLMFNLGRLDVWPVGDYGVRVGFATGWGLSAVPDPKSLLAHGDVFRPYRSVAAWYCWRVMDTRVPAETTG